VAKPGNVKKHGSMPCGNTECFCRVAETYIGSWKQKLTLETLAEQARVTRVPGKMFPRFSGP